MIKIYNYLHTSKALGPYNRFVLWTQGCPFTCEGCMTPDSQNFDDGVEITIDDMVQEILSVTNIEGITISGGEPFMQSKPLCDILDKIQTERDLGVIVYSGFTLEHLKKQKDENTQRFLNHIDILIDGLYYDTLNDNISLRGSSNQAIHQLTDRYNKIFDDYYNKKVREIEIHLQTQDMLIVGIPKKETLQKIII